MSRRLWRSPLTWLGVFTVLGHVGLAIPPARYWAAFALLWLLPGVAWAALMSSGSGGASLDDLALGLGMGLGSTALLILGLHYLPGPLTLPALVVAVDLMLVVVTVSAFLRASPNLTLTGYTPSWASFALVAVPAAALRLINLGYSEFQGDEAAVMIRAGFAILGDSSQLFYHQKGPLEVLLPMGTWTASGLINEWQARLPFALAGVLGILGVYLLGRRWFGERAGTAAALLLAINGYFVGFGRIVQYQSLVLAMTSLGLLALWRWSEGDRDGLLAVGTVLFSFGLLAHYDAVLAVPAAVYIVARRLQLDGRASKDEKLPLRGLVAAAALALVVLGPFYIPFVLHPNFGKTLGYLGGGRMGAGRVLYNNLFPSLSLATFYNSTYYLAGLASAVVVACLLTFRRKSLLVPACCLLLIVVLPGTWTGPVLGGLLAAVLVASDSPAERVAWLWFGVPFLFYYFLVWDPRTHVMNAFPGAVVLTGLTVDRLVPQSSVSARRLVGGILVGTFLFLAGYPLIMFVRHDPEIKRTWPDHQPGLYWRPDLEIPRYGYFGFPYRAGWKAAGVLIQEGVVDGVLATNEERVVADWYTRGAERTYCGSPDWYLVAEDVQDEVPISPEEIADGHELWGAVEVGGISKLKFYRRGTVGQAPMALVVEDYVSAFDAKSRPSLMLSARPTAYRSTAYTLGQDIRLMGYEIEGIDPRPGGWLHLVLYWKALRPVTTNYQVFTHLYAGSLWGQHDGAPACAMRPTTAWEPGRVVRDEHLIPIDPAAPTGDIPVLVGMYSLHSRERLSVRHPSGESIGDAVRLTTISVSSEGTQ